MKRKKGNVLAGFLLIGAAIMVAPVQADEGGITSKSLLDTNKTILDQPIVYPTGSKASINAEILTIRPGAETPWHIHNVPMYAHVLEGEITVNYGKLGTRTYKNGEAFIEAIETPHIGHNSGVVPTKILVVNMGREGLPDAVIVDPPASTAN